LIVIVVTASSDYGKQNQFKKLRDMSKGLVKCRVLRGGQIHKILTSELLVGDICIIDTGDVLPADGVLIKGYNLNMDESSLTGEPIQIAKDAHKDPFLLSGSKVIQGIGRMLVIATGINSLNGRSILALEVEPEKTPLQEKLATVADQVAYFGIGAAVSMFIVLMAGYLASADYSNGSSIASAVIAIVISTITLIVVAVPEGLPLAVVLALSHATVRMLKDNNLVRHLKACETMGNATTICSDKTGTLTLNQMTVLKGSICNKTFEPDTITKFKNHLTGKNDDFLKLFSFICKSVNVNSTAVEELTEDNKMIFSGSKTEIAILNLTKAFGHPYTDDREQAQIIELYPFSSDAKTMCTVVKYKKDVSMENFMGLETSIQDSGDRIWLFVKGAAEMVLSACTSYLDSEGKVSLNYLILG
jgi:Ca2+-transporting ATPase